MSSSCPGFKPHGVKPTRCRRCFKEYSEHVKNEEVPPLSTRKPSITKTQHEEEKKKEEKSSMSSSATAKSETFETTKHERVRPPLTSSASLTVPSSDGNDVKDDTTVTRVRVRTRTSELQIPENSSNDAQEPSPSSGRRMRQRPLSTEVSPEQSTTEANVQIRRSRLREQRLEPDGAELTDAEKLTGAIPKTKSSSPKRIRIIGAEEVANDSKLSPHNDDKTSADVEFILRVKTAAQTKDYDEDSIATETTETTLTGESMEEFQSKINSLSKQLEDAEEKIKILEKDKTDLQTKFKKSEKLKENKAKVSDSDKQALEKTAGEVLKLRGKVRELETANTELKDENNVLKIEVKELNSEVIALKKDNPKELKETITNLRFKLQQTEHLCEELAEENDEIKKDVKALEDEFQELHDNFREDQTAEYRVLKRELETTSKNCRVLQFKLKKSERSVELLEIEKAELDKKVNDLIETSKLDFDKRKMKDLETQLSIAKEVSLKLHTDIEILKEEKTTMEQQFLENFSKQKSINPSSPSAKSPIRLSPGKLSPSVSFEKDKDYETVVRDLYDTMEREKDLQEQLKFAEEESRTMRKKLSTMEQENEILMMQIRKMANQNTKSKKNQNEDDESEELSPEEMKLHLELYEQEMVVLRRKTDELEQENENFQQEIKYLQEKLISQPLTRVEIPQIPEGSPPNVIYEHKIRILETEARELRKKLVDREKENESLRTEVDVHRRKASKVIVRSRSLDSEQQVDLKRQLQLVEQEASILRQKIMTLENENEKLLADNKRFQLRLSRKPPPGPADQLQVENIELKQKITDLERKCENIRGELVASKSHPNLSTLLQRPRDSLSDTESEIINTLKKQVKTKDDENTTLNSKIAQLELECARLNREYKKLKDTVNYKKAPSRTIRETATRGELKDIIKELEEEINGLHRTLKANEVINENLHEELSETKREMESLNSELKNKDMQLNKNMETLNKESEKLRKEIESEKKATKSLQSKVDLMAKEKGTDFSSLDHVETLQAEKKIMAIKIDDLEEELKKEKIRADDSAEKLKAINKLKDELTANSKLLQNQKEKLEDEFERQNDKLRKFETQFKELKPKFEKSEKENIALKKECQTLKNELESEKSKLSAIDSRATGVSASSALIQKENDDLKKQIQESRVKLEHLQNSVQKQEKQYLDKENAIKDEHAKKLEMVARDVRKEAHIEMQTLREEMTVLKNKITELNEQKEKSIRELKDAHEKVKQINTQHRKDKDELNNKLTEYETQIRNEQRKRERIEKDLEAAVKNKDDDSLQAKERIVQLEREHRRTQQRLENIEYEYESKISNLDREIAKDRQEYDDLTNKYELLERDFVGMKSRLITEKDTLVEAVSSIKKSYDEKLIEIKSLKDALNTRQESWFKEKYEFQEKISELQTKVSRFGVSDSERNRMKDMLTEKENLLDSYRKEEKAVKEERDRLRRKCDDLTMKLGEMERVERAARTMTITGKAQEKELQDYRIKLEHNETSHKGDMAALHAEYEGRMKLMGDEIVELQRQIAMLAEERDHYRDQLNRDPTLRRNSRYREDMEDMGAQIKTLRDNLESALLENRNMKIQHGTDRSTWQIQIAELKTKINQSEERILLETTRGSTRNYAKTKMELAWDKERQEQQRLLQDTQRFIQEMRDKLLTNETMREKERYEARKQLQELKEIMDREQEDTQRRIGELQLDLVDLRDSHAKMRSQNERLRRERSVYEKEREDSRLMVFAAIDIQNKSTEVISEFEEMIKLIPAESEKKVVPEVTPKDTITVPGETKKVRRKPSTNVNIEEMRKCAEKVKEKIEELKNVSVPLKDEDRLRRAVSFRRAVSASEMSSMNTPRHRTPLPLPNTIRAPPRPKALAKKSLSLDQTIGASGYSGASREKIWDSGDSAATTPTSSISNLRMAVGHYRGFSAYTGYESESSIGEYSNRWAREGSLGEGSDTSAPAAPKPKKSLKDKFKILKKTRSIEGTFTGDGIAHAGLTSLALHGLEASPMEIAKERQKKENSLKSKISKTLSKTFSKSSSTLTTETPSPQSFERPLTTVDKPLATQRSLSPSSGTTQQPFLPSTLRPISESVVSTKGEKGTKKSIFGRFGSKKDEEIISSPSPSPHPPPITKPLSPPISPSKTIPRIRPETTV